MHHQIVLVLALAAFATAGRLDNLYLPPGSGSRVNAFGGSAGFGVSGTGSNSVYTQSNLNYKSGPIIPILRYNNNNDGSGNYEYEYETANGIKAQETGRQKSADNQEAAGSFAYTSPEGQSFQVTYTADENGFHAQGAHLPTPPPIPEAILKSIQFNLAEEARGGYKDNQGQYNPADEGRYNTRPDQKYLPPQQGYRY